MAVFWRLKHAEDFIASNTDEDEGMQIFSFQVALKGSRKYKVLTFQQFWDIYERLEPKYYYEVIRPHLKCKLFFDLEFEESQNYEKNGLAMVTRLIELIIAKLYEEFGHQVSVRDVLVLQSFHKTKFSSHLVFHQTIFHDIFEVRGFIDNFISNLKEEDRQFFTVIHQGHEQLFIDQVVYKRNQTFRCYMSRKMGRNNPLVVSTISKSSHKVFNQDSMFASLLTFIDNSVEVLKSDFTTHMLSPRQETTFFGATPFKEVDDRLTELIAPGSISSWTYHAESETYCYSITGNTFCRNIGKSHSNSKDIVHFKKREISILGLSK